jgi:hypothetical protein
MRASMACMSAPSSRFVSTLRHGSLRHQNPRSHTYVSDGLSTYVVSPWGFSLKKIADGNIVYEVNVDIPNSPST